MSETLALYAGAIIANRIIGSDTDAERLVQSVRAYYCAATSENDADRQMVKKCLEVYPTDEGYFDHAAVVTAIDHWAIQYVYEVK